MTSAVLSYFLTASMVIWTSCTTMCPEGCNCALITHVYCSVVPLAHLATPSLKLPNASLVHRLELLSGKIFGIDGKFFSELNGLVELDISRNLITELPTGFFDPLNNLSLLRLFRNNQMKEIPPNTFASLHKLKTLHLRENGIHKITRDSFTGLRKVETLNLAFNEIEELEEDLFEHLESLLNLYLNGNRISQLHGAVFCRLELEYLWMQGNQITNITDRLFTGSPSFRSIDLSYNSIVEISSKAFFGQCNLTYISLRENRLHHLDVSLFQDLEKLRYLDLSDNNLTTIETGTFEHLKALRYIDIFNNPIRCNCYLNQTILEWREEDVKVEGSCDPPEQLVPCSGSSRVTNNVVLLILLCVVLTILVIN